jgi:hypothetical protein
VTVGEPAKNVIPINPAILEIEDMSEENMDKTVMLDFSGSLYPISLTSPALHGHAQITEDYISISNTDLET